VSRLTLLAPLLLSVTPPTNLTTSSDAMPPERFRGDAAAFVIFTNPAEVEKLCGPASSPEKRVVGCHSGGVIVLPNPCLTEGERYARLACHELGHRNLWSGLHED
jgi:hypothetical protein